MALEDDILKLLKAEGYRVNEAVRDALDEFVSVIEEEAEDLDDEDDEEEFDEEDLDEDR
jgi:hypothetical protein